MQVPSSSDEKEATELPASPEIQDEARGETLSVVVVDHDGSAPFRDEKKTTWDLFKVGFSRFCGGLSLQVHLAEEGGRHGE